MERYPVASQFGLLPTTITRIYTSRAMGPYEDFSIFFGHINFVFSEDISCASTPVREFCSSAYGHVKLSPGSSQLPPDEIGDILVNRLEMFDDPAIFSALSFPSWFVMETNTSAASTQDVVTRNNSKK
jgi:hypothetical protein